MAVQSLGKVISSYVCSTQGSIKFFRVSLPLGAAQTDTQLASYLLGKIASEIYIPVELQL